MHTVCTTGSKTIMNTTVNSLKLSYLSGTIAIHIQEVEETAMVLVPAGQEGHLHELVHSHPLQLVIPPLQSILKQEPACLQSMACTWATGGQALAAKQGKQPTYQSCAKFRIEFLLW